MTLGSHLANLLILAKQIHRAASDRGTKRATPLLSLLLVLQLLFGLFEVLMLFEL